MSFSPITLGRVLHARAAASMTFTQAEHTPRSALSMHAHERPNLMFVVAGALGERLPGGSFAVATHEIVIKAPGERHANEYGNAATRSLTIEFDDAWLTRSSAFAGLLGRTAHHRSAAAADALLQLLREVRSDDPCAAEELVVGALSELARVGMPARRPSWIGEVRAYLDAQYLDAVSLSTVAETFAIDRTLLARGFRQETGTTIGDYVRRLRIHHACRELAATARPVAEIAAEAGFADQAHLCRVFRARVGATPTEFRRMA
ncbi:MAG TPA: AraC family transcriptional regulator [Thermoanaerobaculia bacterium]|jgi:AraC family transcriptional regulator